jgi:hypothetical protein
MSNSELDNLIESIRNTAREKDLYPITIENIKNNKIVPAEMVDKYIKDNKHLAKLILQNERNHFESIFTKFDFEQKNAIDTLFTVSKEIADNFNKLSPALTHQYRQMFPEIYQENFDLKAEFVYQKIFLHFKKGIWEGLYRDDVSIELVARGFISRLIDLHNPENFPPKEFSFSTVFYHMMENFVKSIATEKGLEYWEEKKKKSGLNL